MINHTFFLPLFFRHNVPTTMSFTQPIKIYVQHLGQQKLIQEARYIIDMHLKYNTLQKYCIQAFLNEIPLKKNQRDCGLHGIACLVMQHCPDAVPQLIALHCQSAGYKKAVCFCHTYRKDRCDCLETYRVVKNRQSVSVWKAKENHPSL
ncbi:hypothetical protein XENOCAPTIV_012667 [Xenoophorus captivus]|uniref:Uncharacterized protein n=1 Tax=Xenoophorus captivus TaxID=1517983 RepID=A0ABV0R9P4_9TELE